jgi:GH24 family phage-related lysozyme (muramidase)
MLQGLHLTENSLDAPVLPASVFLDPNTDNGQWVDRGSTVGMRSQLPLFRPYFKGNPPIEDFVKKANAIACEMIVVLNELNHWIEEWQGGIKAYVDFIRGVKARLPHKKLFLAAPSPGFPDWREWYLIARELFEDGTIHGITVHAYGSLQQMKDIVWWVMMNTPTGLPIFISEFNFGPDRNVVVDRDAWMRDHGIPFLDWCSDFPRIIAACYFAWRWNADMPIGTGVDAADTQIPQMLADWQAPHPAVQPPAPTPKPAPKVDQTTSEAGKVFIHSFEGLALKSYKDVAGVWTIGWGHVMTAAERIKFAHGITRAQADALFDADLKWKAEVHVNRLVKVSLTQAQFDVLVSFTFNFGGGALAGAYFLPELNSGDYSAIPRWFPKWINAGGKPFQGLINRRRREINLWNTGRYDDVRSKRLVTRYVSQNGSSADYARGDCGFACLTALAQTVGKNYSVDSLAAMSGLPPGFTSARIDRHIQATATKIGIVLAFNGETTAEQMRKQLDKNQSIILRVWYPRLLRRRLANYNDWHFIHVTGYEGNDFFYDDPEWFTASDGEDIRISADALIHATRYNSNQTTPGQALFLKSHILPERK